MAEYTVYPNQIDGPDQLPKSTDLVTPVKAEVVNRLRDSILAIEKELGVQPSSTFGTVKDRLDSLTGLINSLSDDLDALEVRADVLESNSGKVKVSNADTTFSFLEDKITAGTNVTISKLNAGSDELLQISSSGGGGGGAHASTHEQGGSDELTAQNLGSGSASDGYIMVADGLGGWNVEENVGGGTGVVITPIIAGSQDTGSTTETGKGACILNPGDLGYPDASFTLEVILQVTDSNFDGYFELFNVTDGYVVTHDEIKTNSLTPVFIEASLTIGSSFNLPDGQDNLLEGRIYLESGATAGDRVVCKYAVIRSKPV